MQPPLRQKHPYRVLYVEDEEAIRMQVQKSLNRLFEEVVVATNGEEGVQAFIEKPSHLIITDVIMPRMDGLEMARRIREIDRSVPIIVITALSDVNRLIEAIDIGVSRFLLKPLLIPKLHEAINKVLKEVEYISLKNELERTNEKLKLKNSQLQAAMEELARTKEAEVELLRLKENYHLQQQEIALRKQNQIMRDELTHLAEGGWLFRNYFRPLDILSGDTYGTAKIGENLYLFYIVDAMGKGLSASVTAIQSASFLNHAIDHSRSKNDFNLERLIRDYCAFIRGQILEEEIVCSLFLMLDLAKSELSVVNFGMPPLYIEQSDKTVISIPANNPPIMGYYVTLNIDRYQLDIMTRIMGYSDGVNELTNDKGVIFGTHLEESFKKRVTPNELVAEMQHFSSSSFDDDITILWIERDQCTVLASQHAKFPSSLEGVNSANAWLEEMMETMGKDQAAKVSLLFAANELFMNALEHGNLGISGELKETLMRRGSYEHYLLDQIASEANRDKKIECSVYLCRKNDDNYIKIVVEDMGEGFDRLSIFRKLMEPATVRFHQRGLIMIQQMVDGLYFNFRGNKTFIIKKIGKENK